jgi:hypothetical protein
MREGSRSKWKNRSLRYCTLTKRRCGLLCPVGVCLEVASSKYRESHFRIQVLAYEGVFWSQNPYQPVVKTIPCRDHTTLFKRNVAWVRTCHRNDQQCADPACMRLIQFEDVREALQNLCNLRASPNGHDPHINTVALIQLH